MAQNIVVTQTIQGKLTNGAGERPLPVDVTWYRGTDHVQALAALVSAGADKKEDSYYTVLAATITFE